MRSLFLSLLALAGSWQTFAQQDPASSQKNAEESLRAGIFAEPNMDYVTYTIPQRMKELKVNGASVTVIDNGRITWTRGYGLKDVSEPGSLVDTATLFQCASIGKVVTALAALQLIKEGRIGLDEPVNQKLKSWKIPASKGMEQEVTLRHLLSHTAGFDDDYGFEGYDPQQPLPGLIPMLNGERPANIKKKLIVKTKPGKTERYSGGGYLVVQQLIEDLSGQSFEQYVTTTLFSPLHMRHSTYACCPDVQGNNNMARGHDEKGKVDKKLKYKVYPEMAAAGFWTTSYDLALLVLEIQKGRKGQSTILPDSSLLREMLRPQINTTGLGMHLKGYKDVSAFWHSGNNAGYTALLFGTLEGQGAIVMTNSDDGITLALDVIRSIANTYQWPAMQTLHLHPAVATEEQTLMGSYGRAPGTVAVVGADPKGLYLQPSGSGPRLRIYRLTDGAYTIQQKPDHFRLYFTKDETGKVSALRFEQDCGTQVGTLEKTN
ncbi:serine hydrolase domain-containing protein [Taibaiella chishuiensis]|uniref:CubicO group peptidase (Beta-lactamase class C family) n=1 Tax=Taibaiella chishuiensis TaxID=1434707 RepID=A0A2P8D1U2_9BACT|nr:serine hydrolase domain-containing protein [Taibaiella chishuiensis]PSK91182.1 CubicO group peptidase (beta-lactamase class C family) [Taibaiella chishuiensis]